MKKFVILESKAALALCVALFSVSAFAADAGFDIGLKNESSVGIVISGGNAKSQSINLSQLTSYGWDADILRFTGRFLRTVSNNVESVRSWGLGLRYERVLSPRFNLYAGQGLESNIFTGFFQRYNTDLGLKYKIMKAEDFEWDAEAGYRYSYENRLMGSNTKFHFVRLYTGVQKNWNKDVSSKFWFEFLPNLTQSDAFQVNTEVSTSAVLTSIFSIKVSYLAKFLNLPPPTAVYKTDSIFTTALVAKF